MGQLIPRLRTYPETDSPQADGVSGAPSPGSQRPPEPVQALGGKGGKSSKGKETAKGKSKGKYQGKN